MLLFPIWVSNAKKYEKGSNAGGIPEVKNSGAIFETIATIQYVIKGVASKRVLFFIKNVETLNTIIAQKTKNNVNKSIKQNPYRYGEYENNSGKKKKSINSS